MKMNTKAAMIGVGKLGQACAEVMAESYPMVGMMFFLGNQRISLWLIM